jgi:hypothetical protein
MAIDDRTLLGVNIWLKPTKFFLSFMAYLPTAAWMLSLLVESRPRLVKTLGWLFSITAYIEMLAIAGQAARGVRSHFNVATPFDRVVFSSMGIAVVVFYVATIVLAVVLLRLKMTDRVHASGLRLGLGVALVGMGVGGFMTQPTAEQMARMKAGERVAIIGTHTFRGEDGGPGLPLVNWSTVAGDMRPAHFVGMHALQVLPLLAFFIGRRGRRLDEGQKVALVRGAGLLQLGLTVSLAQQALRGQSIVAPDALTLSLFALSLVVGFAVAGFGLRRAAPATAPAAVAVG